MLVIVLCLISVMLVVRLCLFVKVLMCVSKKGVMVLLIMFCVLVLVRVCVVIVLIFLCGMVVVVGIGLLMMMLLFRFSVYLVWMKWVCLVVEFMWKLVFRLLLGVKKVVKLFWLMDSIGMLWVLRYFSVSFRLRMDLVLV